jgi:hypothetical protein
MDKIYRLENCNVRVCFDRGLIRVYSDEELWKYLNDQIKNKLNTLVDLIKIDYKNEFKADLNISKSSLLVEIWVHICSDYYGLSILRIVKAKWLRALIIKGIKRAEVIDCGENKKDSNRWVWDILAYIKPLIFWFGPRNMNKKRLK